MIKLVYFMRRQSRMSAEAFHDYWRTHHAPLISSHAATFDIQRYVQLHATGDPRNAPTEAFPERYDGVAELWFGGEAGFEQWMENTSPEARAAGKAIRGDERKFIDRHNSPYLIGREETIIE